MLGLPTLEKDNKEVIANLLKEAIELCKTCKNEKSKNIINEVLKEIKEEEWIAEFDIIDIEAVITNPLNCNEILNNGSKISHNIPLNDSNIKILIKLNSLL